jgi:hypothetical protein
MADFSARTRSLRGNLFRTVFDGHWKQQGLSEAAYQQKVADADQQYAKLLSVLVAAAKATPGA